MISENEISAIDGMEGHEFEYFCANLLRMVGFYDVKVTPGSGDQGVDILAEKDGIKYAIQCKNYASAFSNTPVQEVSAGKQFYGCHVGVVMTNSTFTPGAVQLAQANNILLWDRQKLAQLISQAGGLAKLGIDLDDDFEDEFDAVDSEDDDTIMSYNFEKQDFDNYIDMIQTKSNLPRKGMTIWFAILFSWSVCCLFIGLLGLLMQEVEMASVCLGEGLFTLVFSLMFRKFSKTEKMRDSVTLFGKEIKKPLFVFLCIVIAYILFIGSMVIMGGFELINAQG